MNLTILYRVLWKPASVFREFREETRKEPFIFIGILIAINTIGAARNDFSQITNPAMLLAGILHAAFRSLLFPGFSALIVQLAARHLFEAKAKYLQIMSALILCSLPFYISSWLSSVIGISRNSFGLGSMIPSMQETHPLVFGFVASINPFSIWAFVLMYIAQKEIFGLSRRQSATLLLVLIVSGIILNGLWLMLAVYIFNIYNPAT